MGQLDLYIHSYFIVAIGYNVASQIWLDLFGKKLAPTDPTLGILVMTVVYLVFLLEDALPRFSFGCLMTLWTVAILRFGIFQHLLNYDPELYWSRASWVLAFLTNIIGVGLFSTLLFMRFS